MHITEMLQKIFYKVIDMFLNSMSKDDVYLPLVRERAVEMVESKTKKVFLRKMKTEEIEEINQ